VRYGVALYQNANQCSYKSTKLHLSYTKQTFIQRKIMKVQHPNHIIALASCFLQILDCYIKMLSQEQTERGHRRVYPMASSTLGGIIDGTFKPNNINGGDVQSKNVVNNVDKSSLWTP